MPRGDGMGPEGFGPMTGRGIGYCAGFNRPGFANFPRGFRGRGAGFGGYGWRRGFRHFYHVMPYGQGYEKPSPEYEARVLKEESDILRRQLETIEKRLSELETEKEGPNE